MDQLEYEHRESAPRNMLGMSDDSINKTSKDQQISKTLFDT